MSQQISEDYTAFLRSKAPRVASVGIEHGRKFVGVELKETYWRQACKHIATAEATSGDLFAGIAAQ